MIAPYDEKRIVPNVAEAGTIRLVVNLDKRDMSNREIREELTRRGLKPRGKVWYPTTVRRILDRHAD